MGVGISYFEIMGIKVLIDIGTPNKPHICHYEVQDYTELITIAKEYDPKIDAFATGEGYMIDNNLFLLAFNRRGNVLRSIRRQ